jgi:hypothetical protein
MSLLAVSLVAVALALPLGIRAQPADFIVGVLTWDSILPLARYSAGKWINDWPGPEEDEARFPALHEVPMSWLGQAVPRTWSVWFARGGSTSVTVSATKRYGGCESPVALQLSAAPPLPPNAIDGMHPGVATFPSRPAERIRLLAERTVSDALRLEIVRAARRLGDRSASTKWLFSTGRVYYFENRVKRIGASKWPMTGQGWVHRSDTGAFRVVHITRTGCENEDGSLPCLIPIGAFRFGDHEVWVMEHPTGETGAFELWQVTRDAATMVLSINHGGC